MDIVERIKKLAESRNMNLKELALKLNMGENSIYRWNKNKPTLDNLQKVADYFDVSTDFILGREPGMKNIPKEVTVESALDSVMSYDGKPLTENDREVLKGIIEAYLKNK